MGDTRGFMILLLLFLGKQSFIDSKDTSVTCIIHDDCILPCSFRPISSVVIHWYKQQIPVHSYYYNNDQFGLQNKHFSGRTFLFNSQIAYGNASLLLRRIKVQDRGRYKCYTSTRKGNQETFVNLEVKALINSVNMEMTDETVSCSSHNIFPVPQVAWATDPPSAHEALKSYTIKTTDHKGLFTVESTLKLLGNASDYTYFCSFVSADKTQVWTASQKKQESITQEEGHTLLIPCIAPSSLQNFSLTWTFSSSTEPAVILRYDSRTKHTFNMWEGHADLDQDRLLLGEGTLSLHKPASPELSGTYTCTFSGLQSRHTVQTKVNITEAPISVDNQSGQRSWWSTAASAAFVIFTVIIAFPQCVRQTASRTAPLIHNGVVVVEVGVDKDLNAAASYLSGQHGANGNRHLQFPAQHERAGTWPKTPEDCTVSLIPEDREIKQEENLLGSKVEGKDELQSDPEGEGSEST